MPRHPERHPVRRTLTAMGCALLACFASTSTAFADDQLVLLLASPDAPDRELWEQRLQAGRARVEAFFGAPFREPLTVGVHPDRAAFTASFPAEWGLTDTACWMVAYGVADRLSVLSTRVWAEQACEHDPADAVHVERLLAHELVHAYHGQHNPTRDFTGIEEPIGWFAEGLGVYASGQFDEARRAQARDALARDAGPEGLVRAWSGPDRYAICGSLVAFLDARVGRDGLIGLLAATELETILSAAGHDEATLLAAWRRTVLEGEPPAPVAGAVGGLDLRDGQRPEGRQFDFWLGTWDVALRTQQPDGSWAHWIDAEAQVFPLLRGRAVLELWDSEPIKGFSLRTYDPEHDRWELWLNWPGGGRSGSSSMHGGFHHGRGEFTSRSTTPDGGESITRYTFSDITDDSLRWDDAFSRDGGSTWTHGWIMEFTRTAARPELPPLGGPAHTFDTGARCTDERFAVLDAFAGRWRAERTEPDGGVTPFVATGWQVLDGCALLMTVRWEDARDGRRETFLHLTFNTYAGRYELLRMSDDEARPAALYGEARDGGLHVEGERLRMVLTPDADGFTIATATRTAGGDWIEEEPLRFRR